MPISAALKKYMEALYVLLGEGETAIGARLVEYWFRPSPGRVEIDRILEQVEGIEGLLQYVAASVWVHPVE